MVILHRRMALQAAASTACFLMPIPHRLRSKNSFGVAMPPAFSRPASFSALFSSSSSSSNSSSSSSSCSGLSSLSSHLPSTGSRVESPKPEVCTADELHYVDVPGAKWRIALWRYLPCPKAPTRNHPLVLLSGVGTNAIGFDLSPGASFARHMSNQGFDTWIVELRGAGLSSRIESKTIEQTSINSITSKPIYTLDQKLQNGSISKQQQSVEDVSLQDLEVPIVDGKKGSTLTSLEELQFVNKLTDTLLLFTEKLSGYLSESQLKVISDFSFERISNLLVEAGLSDRFNEIQEKFSTLLKERQNSAASNQIRDLSKKIVNLLYEGQRSVSPQIFDLQERFSATIEDFMKQLDLIFIYDWDFDHHLEEDIPAAMEYIKCHSQPKDGKLFAIGHSMGGIILYAMLSRSAFKGSTSELAAVVTLASSLDYTPSKSSLKLLLTLADPAHALNVPAVPLGALMAAAYPFLTRPPYVLSQLHLQISAGDMMDPELFEKLVLNNFGTISAKLLLQLTTAFREGGLRDRSGTFYYKDHLYRCNTPVLAVAGDQDLICPQEAVYETVKLFPQHGVSYKVFGKQDGAHYGHYDLVGGRLAIDEIYPCIIEFFRQQDGIHQ